MSVRRVQPFKAETKANDNNTDVYTECRRKSNTMGFSADFSKTVPNFEIIFFADLSSVFHDVYK